MPHVVLLGDSIFDNRAYVGGGPDVIAQLRQKLPPGWTATLLARDGATLSGIPAQLRNLPPDATHLVVSAGGNDALGYSGVLDQAAPSIAEALLRLASISAAFEADYRSMRDDVLSRGLPTVLCTIYDPNFPDPTRQRLGMTALRVLNDPIIRSAAANGIPLIDLRLVCSEPADYANPIEPSSKGGDKISAAILAAVGTHDFAARRTAIYW